MAAQDCTSTAREPVAPTARRAARLGRKVTKPTDSAQTPRATPSRTSQPPSGVPSSADSDGAWVRARSAAISTASAMAASRRAPHRTRTPPAGRRPPKTTRLVDAPPMSASSPMYSSQRPVAAAAEAQGDVLNGLGASLPAPGGADAEGEGAGHGVAVHGGHREPVDGVHALRQRSREHDLQAERVARHGLERRGAGHRPAGRVEQAGLGEPGVGLLRESKDDPLRRPRDRRVRRRHGRGEVRVGEGDGRREEPGCRREDGRQRHARHDGESATVVHDCCGAGERGIRAGTS